MRVVYEGIEKYDGAVGPMARGRQHQPLARTTDVGALAGRAGVALGIALLGVFVMAMIAAALI